MSSPLLRLAAPAAAVSMLGFLGLSILATPALAQSTGSQTCRSALGEDFSVSTATATLSCCLVLEEKPWYDEKGVVASRSYAVAGGSDVVRPKICDASEIMGNAVSTPPATDDDDDDGNPPTPPDTQSLGSDNDDPPPQPTRQPSLF